MAGFNTFFPDDTPEAAPGNILAQGELIHFEGRVYAATAEVTLPDPITAAALEGLDLILLSGVTNTNNPGTPLSFWSGTRAEYDALGADRDQNTIYNITDD